ARSRRPRAAAATTAGAGRAGPEAPRRPRRRGRGERDPRDPRALPQQPHRRGALARGEPTNALQQARAFGPGVATFLCDTGASPRGAVARSPPHGLEPTPRMPMRSHLVRHVRAALLALVALPALAACAPPMMGGAPMGPPPGNPGG